MQKRGVVDKGFILTVILILGAVLVVSFLNQGTTGQYHESTITVETVSADCPPSKDCGSVSVISATGHGRTEQKAISNAMTACKEKREKQEKEVDECISEATLACLKADCVPLPDDFEDVPTPCQVQTCSEKIYTGVGGIYKICTYYYEKGIRLEPPLCDPERYLSIFDPAMTWECTAEDGYYSGQVGCEPKPTKQD